MEKRMTIWERMTHLPTRKRSELRRKMADAMAIEPHSVLKHLQAHSWEELKPLYKKVLVSVTGISEHNWSDEEYPYITVLGNGYCMYLPQTEAEHENAF